VHVFLRSPLAAGFFISTLVFLGIVTLRNTGSLESTELATYDWQIRLQPKVSESKSRIVLLEVTDNCIKSQGQWPLTDGTVNQILKILIPYGPRAIGLDLYRDMPIPPGGEELDATLNSNPTIMTTMKFGGEQETGVSPPWMLKNPEQLGFNDILVDRGGIVRRGLLFLDDGKNVYYSFALRLALLYLQAEGIAPQADKTNPQHIRLGKVTIRPLQPNEGGYVGADDRGYQFLLDYKHIQSSADIISLETLLTGRIQAEAIRDKIVIIGTTAEGVKDFFYTPFSRGFNYDQQISGIALHAYIVNQLLRVALAGDSPLQTLSEVHEWLWILLWSFLGGALGLGVRSPWKFTIFSLTGLLCLFSIVYGAFLNGWWIPLIPPAMAWVISASVDTAYMANLEKRERASLMSLFSKHVSPEVAAVIWKERSQFSDGGRPRSQKLIETVMFTDLKGFTSMTEKLDPHVLIDWLNTYLEAMAKLVMDHGGIIDEYTGDGFKADFGVPVPRTTETEMRQDAMNAVRCALAMEEEMKRLNAFWQERNLPTGNLRIGIFTGPVVAGSLGSAQRLKYTTIGDTVNIASRLESYDKDYLGPDPTHSPCRILIGETTLSHLGDQFNIKKVGEVSLKGKIQKITIYHVFGRIHGHPNGRELGETS
jgi:adenylate cyclase